MNTTAIAILLLLPVLVGFGMTRFFRGLPNKCPPTAELQSDFVQTFFEQSKMDGFWYELAMKDFDLHHLGIQTGGVMAATWNSVIPFVNRIVFPNTVVDVEVDAMGNYEWMIEFQCIQGPRVLGVDWISFYAFNFYSRTFDDPNRVDVMETRARQRGLGPFIDHWFQLKAIDHSDCLYGH